MILRLHNVMTRVINQSYEFSIGAIVIYLTMRIDFNMVIV